MTKDKKTVEIFSAYTESPDGLYIHTEGCKNNFFICQRDDGKIKVLFTDNSTEGVQGEAGIGDSIALSVLSDEKDLYKLVLIGYGQFKVEQFQHTFFTTKNVKEKIEKFLRKCPSYIVDRDGSIYQCVYKGMKLRVEYHKPSSGFEELVQASIFGAMKEQLCNYKKWFNAPYMRDPIHFGSRINPNATVLDNGNYLLNGKEYDKNGKEKQGR